MEFIRGLLSKHQFSKYSPEILTEYITIPAIIFEAVE